jgi:hypothetical protein
VSDSSLWRAAIRGPTRNLDEPRPYYEGKHTDVVSSLRVDVRGVHAHVRVWNRGGLAGTLTVDSADVQELVRRLVGSGG